MTVTIEVINKGTLNLMRDMEGLGLIHMQPPASRVTEKTAFEDNRPNRWLRGCCKNLPGNSVDEFLANCRADKEREAEKLYLG